MNANDVLVSDEPLAVREYTANRIISGVDALELCERATNTDARLWLVNGTLENIAAVAQHVETLGYKIEITSLKTLHARAPDKTAIEPLPCTVDNETDVTKIVFLPAGQFADGSGDIEAPECSWFQLLLLHSTSNSKRSKITLLTGGPGRGKSLALRWLAAHNGMSQIENRVVVFFSCAEVDEEGWADAFERFKMRVQSCRPETLLICVDDFDCMIEDTNVAARGALLTFLRSIKCNRVLVVNNLYSFGRELRTEGAFTEIKVNGVHQSALAHYLAMRFDRPLQLMLSLAESVAGDARAAINTAKLWARDALISSTKQSGAPEMTCSIDRTEAKAPHVLLYDSVVAERCRCDARMNTSSREDSSSSASALFDANTQLRDTCVRNFGDSAMDTIDYTTQLIGRNAPLMVAWPGTGDDDELDVLVTLKTELASLERRNDANMRLRRQNTMKVVEMNNLLREQSRVLDALADCADAVSSEVNYYQNCFDTGFNGSDGTDVDKQIQLEIGVVDPLYTLGSVGSSTKWVDGLKMEYPALQTTKQTVAHAARLHDFYDRLGEVRLAALALESRDIREKGGDEENDEKARALSLEQRAKKSVRIRRASARDDDDGDSGGVARAASSGRKKKMTIADRYAIGDGEFDFYVSILLGGLRHDPMLISHAAQKGDSSPEIRAIVWRFCDLELELEDFLFVMSYALGELDADDRRNIDPAALPTTSAVSTSLRDLLVAHFNRITHSGEAPTKTSTKIAAIKPIVAARSAKSAIGVAATSGDAKETRKRPNPRTEENIEMTTKSGSEKIAIVQSRQVKKRPLVSPGQRKLPFVKIKT